MKKSQPFLHPYYFNEANNSLISRLWPPWLAASRIKCNLLLCWKIQFSHPLLFGRKACLIVVYCIMVALAPNGFLCSAKNHHWNPSFAVRADFGVDPIISSLCLIIISWLGAEPVASISGTFLIFIKGGVSERRFKLKKPLDIQMVLLSAITTLLSCSYGRCLA